jgi:hypothetical protein
MIDGTDGPKLKLRRRSIRPRIKVIVESVRKAFASQVILR